MRKSFVVVFLILFSSLILCGNIYFWVDENGTKHFSNITPPFDKAVAELTERNSDFRKNQIFKVLKVYDGDTIQVQGLDLKFKIRLVGIDSPEIGFKSHRTQPFAQEAKSYLKHLLGNKKIRVVSYGTGAYNRQLAEVFLENKNINIEMIKAGLAEVYTGKKPQKLDSRQYLVEESMAKRNRQGMWTQGTFYKSPKQWRKENPRK